MQVVNEFKAGKKKKIIYRLLKTALSEVPGCSHVKYPYRFLIPVSDVIYRRTRYYFSYLWINFTNELVGTTFYSRVQWTKCRQFVNDPVSKSVERIRAYLYIVVSFDVFLVTNWCRKQHFFVILTKLLII